MNKNGDSLPSYGGHRRPDEAVNPPPRPGQMPLMLAGLAIGMLLMGIQLWLLTIALDLYLGGAGHQVWLIALVSGAIFLGGLLMLRLLRRQPQVRQGSIEERKR